jgi:CheY-like chemotaxis protein
VDLALGYSKLTHISSAMILRVFSSCEVRNVKNISRATILYVDDDPCMRELMAMILNEEGYEVSTATDGFDALDQLRNSLPDLIISDLQMPRMSGIEFLSVVRHRFPAIPAMAISGAFDWDEFSPAGVMADAFYPKSRCHPDELIHTVRELMYQPLNRPTNYRPCQPPKVQTARSVQDANGNLVCLLTCTDCLRGFSCAGEDSGRELQQARCQFCMTTVKFINDVHLPASGAIISGCDAATMPAA